MNAHAFPKRGVELQGGAPSQTVREFDYNSPSQYGGPRKYARSTDRKKFENRSGRRRILARYFGGHLQAWEQNFPGSFAGFNQEVGRKKLLNKELVDRMSTLHGEFVSTVARFCAFLRAVSTVSVVSLNLG